MSSTHPQKASGLDHIRRQVRILAILDGCRIAGLVGVRVSTLHLLAFLANTLAPVWHLDPMDASVLKRQDGPLYPEIQRDIDRLVGMGLVNVIDPGHAQGTDGRWRPTGAYQVRTEVAAPVLTEAAKVGHPDAATGFLRELAFAVSALPSGDLVRIPSTDATYADPVVSVGDVIDFGDWRDVNYSANAARHFRHFLPSADPTSAELIHMYIRLAAERLRPSA